MFGRVDVGAVAAELRVPDVVEHDEHHVRRAAGGSGSGGHQAVDSRQVGPITPPKSPGQLRPSLPARRRRTRPPGAETRGRAQGVDGTRVSSSIVLALAGAPCRNQPPTTNSRPMRP